jgi:RsiW-degrading membrane proteinase PrsW (M82 family)
MTWRRYLQSRTRNVQFLWRMVFAILLTGVAIGVAVDWAVDADPSKEIAAEEAAEDESPEEIFPGWERLERFAEQENWLALWGAIPGAMLESWRDVGATVLAVLTGLCWLAFVLQAIQIRSRRDGRLWASLIAVGFGVLSIWPTLFLIFWQERRWNLTESEELTAGIRFYVLGVALREEASKFICFLPLLPYLVRRRDELAALLTAGCVGIGFAMEENIGYIGGTTGIHTLGRLLMPAPLHMAMTGLVGLAAYRACVWPKECGPQFVAMFGVIVLAHGLYDAFAALPAIAEYGLVGYLIFVFIIYQFFHELRPKQKLLVEPISLTANFLFCVSTVAAATFVYVSAQVGCYAAAMVLFQGIVAEALMVYLFLREMPETMVTV